MVPRPAPSGGEHATSQDDTCLSRRIWLCGKGYSCGYTPDEVGQAIRNLIDQKYLLYLKRSNDYLQLKQASGVDIRQKISDTVERQRASLSIKDILNSVNFDNYIYPARYNDEREMTRYF